MTDKCFIKLNKESMRSGFNANRHTPNKYQIYYSMQEIQYKEITSVVNLYEKQSIFGVQFRDLVPPDFEDRVVVCGEYVLNSIIYNEYSLPECDIELVYMFNKDFNNKFNMYIAYLFAKFEITNIYVFQDWVIFKTSPGFYIKIIVYLCHSSDLVEFSQKSNDIVDHYGSQHFNALIYYQNEYYGTVKSECCVKQAAIRFRGPDRTGSFCEYHIRKALHKGFSILFDDNLENMVCELGCKYQSGYGFILAPTTNIYEYEDAFRAKYHEITREFFYSRVLAYIANIHQVTNCGYNNNFSYQYPIIMNLVHKKRVVQCLAKDVFINDKGTRFTNLELYCMDHRLDVDNGSIYKFYYLTSDEFMSSWFAYKIGESGLPNSVHTIYPEFYVNPPKIELYMYNDILNNITKLYRPKFSEKVLF